MNVTPDPEPHRTTSWREAAVDFVSARVELLSLEAREAGQQAAKRAAMGGVAAACGFIAWMTVVAGVIGWLAAAQVMPWHFAALGAAALHLGVAGIAVAVMRRSAPPAFPLSKAELLKDREWLLNLKDQPKR